MIVVSGVLVLVALVFLIIGLFGDGLGFIWASIITSVVAGVFLLLGALQRRGPLATAGDTGPTSPEMLERVTAVSVRPREEAAPAAEAAGSPQVAIVPGRGRYHVEGCRFLAGRPDVETMALDEAKSGGYTACGVCKPDQNAVAPAPAFSLTEEAEEPYETADVMAGSDDAVGASDEAATDETAILAAPGRKSTARKPAAKKTAAATKATATKATATKAAKPAAKAASGVTVVAVPDRGKYHTDTCRFASAPGALSMSRTSAKRQGLAPCGVCKPG